MPEEAKVVTAILEKMARLVEYEKRRKWIVSKFKEVFGIEPEFIIIDGDTKFTAEKTIYINYKEISDELARFIDETIAPREDENAVLKLKMSTVLSDRVFDWEISEWHSDVIEIAKQEDHPTSGNHKVRFTATLYAEYADC